MNTEMKKYEALANSLLSKYVLDIKGWRFQWNNKKTAFGSCNRRRKTIELSSFLLPTLDEASIKDTILHELAHALDVNERGYSNHDKNWKRWAIAVGAVPKSTQDFVNLNATSEVAAQSKYSLVCPNGHTFPSHRKKKRNASCRICSEKSGLPGYQPKFKFTQIQNY